MQITQNLTLVNKTSGNSGREYIVIHYTANYSDTAAGNANYFKSVNRGASAHYFVDESHIVQVVSDNDTAWSVGRNFGSNNLFGQCTNENSLNIEMCSTNGKIAQGTINNTVELTRSLMKKYNIPASRVVRHWDVCSKDCPGRDGWGVSGRDSSTWNQFKKDIQSNPTTSNETKGGEEEMRCLFTIDGKSTVYYFDGEKIVSLTNPDQMKILRTIYKDNNGRDMPFYKWTSKAPWYTRLLQVINRKEITNF